MDDHHRKKRIALFMRGNAFSSSFFLPMKQHQACNAQKQDKQS